tara:strand:- start:689 stop:943 length:255 start_codon:yes stop_codon:yes gene_type:complete
MKKEMQALVDAVTLMGSRTAVAEAIELAVSWADEYEPTNEVMQAVKELIQGIEELHDDGHISKYGYDCLESCLDIHDDWKHDDE